MASLVTPVSGDPATAELFAQLTELFSGLRNIPVSLTGVNDASAYALTTKNAGTGSKDAIMYAADGTTVLFQVDGNGVLVSRAGGAAEAVLTATSPMFATWTAFTPTLTQGVALTLSVATGRYIQLGKLVIASVDITINSAGTASNALTLGALPVSSAQRGTPGNAYYSDNNVSTNYSLTPFWTGATTMVFATNASTSRFGINPAVTAAAADLLNATLIYEAS